MASRELDLEALLAAAVEIENTVLREEYIQNVCLGNAKQLGSLRSMVNDYFAAGSLIEHPVQISIASSLVDQQMIGENIGPYKLMEILGEGGMGCVYVAEQREPIRRKVALKVIKPGMDSKQVLARFEAERQTLAMMDHPHISRVLDAGITDGGYPFFAMELIKGQPLTEHCGQAGLDIRGRLELFLQLCRAVQHAHQKGIIHRDLKPNNVLVAMHDTVPVVKVIDFGVAKALDRQASDQTIYTGLLQLIGTPLYMSPEQAGQSSLDIDTRSDIYSLGVILYELLTETTPFESETLKRAGVDEMRRIIREVDPPRPSVRVSTLRAATTTTMGECRTATNLGRALRGELDWIVMKAMEKDRTRRYETANALAEDVQRFLNNEPVEAHRITALGRTLKWLRRHPASTVVIAVTLVSAIVLAGQAFWHNARLRSSLAVSDKLRNDGVRRERELREQLYSGDVRLAWQLWLSGDESKAHETLQRHESKKPQEDTRGFAWHYLHNVLRDRGRVVARHESSILAAAACPHERWLATSDKSGMVRITDLSSDVESASWRNSEQEVTSLRFSHDASTLATAGQDQTIRLYRVGSWEEIACLRGHDGTITAIDWSPDDRQLVSGSRDHKVLIWDVNTQKAFFRLEGHTDAVRDVAWSPDGKWIASCGRDPEVRLWDANRGLLRSAMPGQDDLMLRLAFNSNSRWLACGGYHGVLNLYDVSLAKFITRYDASGQIFSLVFADEDDLLLAGKDHGRVELIRINRDTGQPAQFREAGIHNGTLRAVVLPQGSRNLITASEEELSVVTRPLLEVVGNQRLRFSDECLCILDAPFRAITTNGPDLGERCMSPDTFRVLQSSRKSVFRRAVSSPDGSHLAAATELGGVIVMNTQTGTVMHLESVGKELASLTFQTKGQLIAAGTTRGELVLWDHSSGKLAKRITVLDEGVSVEATFSPDGNRLFAVCADRLLDWDLAHGQQTFHSLDAPKWCLAVSPDGTRLALGGEQHCSLWDAGSMQELQVLSGHRRIYLVAFSPDGRTLATLGDDRSIRLWHVRTGRELLTLAELDCDVRWLQFTPDGRLMVGTHRGTGLPNEVLVFDGRAE
ncbi:MAG: protein kinase [Planctomycetales bacterium]|nr:protein kinase [Planctomycetales bacterium]